MTKICLIGISGVGKSYWARKLSARLHLPVVHYDTLCWGKNWTEVEERLVYEKLRKELQKDAWILEGYIAPAAKERLEAADVVLYLDYPGWRAVQGGLRRWWQHRKTPRPELADGCEERWSWERLWIMWTRDERREIEKEIRDFGEKVVRLRSPREVAKFLAQLCAVRT